MSKPTTPSERLEILLNKLRKSKDWTEYSESLVTWGFDVGQHNGDDHIAKVWVDDYRTANGQNTEKG
jgi:hypothetical protein